jgi:hypothetical protein
MQWSHVSKLRFDTARAGTERFCTPTMSLASPDVVTRDMVSRNKAVRALSCAWHDPLFRALNLAASAWYNAQVKGW